MSIAAALSSGVLLFPHFGDCTQEGQPSSQGHSRVRSRAHAHNSSTTRQPSRAIPTPPGCPS